jgi:RNA polymerase sigma-70 factor (ECF subfamily)
MPDDPTLELLERWRRGDATAAEELFARYAARLTRLAEQHLSRPVQQRVEGADVVQSVFRTFFRRSQAGQFTINGGTDLWRLLVRITLLKAHAQGRRHTAACRDVRAEGAAVPLAAVARDPDPADAAAVVDLMSVLLRGQPPLFADVLEKRLQGESVTDIARHLRLSRKTIHEVLRQLKQRLETLLPASSD